MKPDGSADPPVLCADDLRRALDRLSIAQRAGRLGVFEWDIALNVVHWTPELEALFGLTSPERYEVWAARVHPDDLGRLEALLAEWFASTRAEERWEFRFLRGDGEERWIEASARLERDARGRPLRMIGTNLDVTEHVRLREELLREQQRLRAMFENVALGVAELAPDGRIINVNGRLPQMLGYAREELLQMTVADLTYDDDRDRSEVFNRRIFDGVTDIDSYEKRYRRKDGSPVWVRVTVSGVRDSAGRVVRSIGTVEDITERKRAEEARSRSEEALRASEAKFRSVFEQAAIGMARVRFPDGRWIDVNDAFCRIVGRSREELLATAWPDMTHPEDRARDLGTFGQMQRGELESYSIEKRFLDPQGRVVWARLTLSLVRDVTGAPDYEIVIVEDIGERKRAREEQQRLLSALREADQRKSEFLAILSHELRNPLAPIRNSLYILERAEPGGAQAERARQVIDRQVVHLTRLIDDLLDVTRISRGKVRLQREVVDLCELLLRAGEDHRSLFAAAGVELQVELCEGPVHVRADATRLSQVIGNLLSNAAKFTPRGGHVRLWLEQAAGWATIHVEDDGAGIPASLLSKLFEPFVQADATLDRSKGGLGLGLALVKGLVELHGGSVEARSDGAGRGAEMVVRLPLRLPTRLHARAEDEGEAAGPAHEVRAPLRVLVIEDDADAAAGLKAALERSGHEVVVASSGPEGLERAHAHRPDVVICDLALPGMDGFEVARRMRADPELHDAPLVALSREPSEGEGHREGEGERARSAAAGFDQHLVRPPDLGRLERALRWALEPEGRGRSA